MHRLVSLTALLPATVGALLAQSAAAPANPISAGAKAIYNVVKTNVIKAAEKMPEENYSFRPTPDVRTFGQLIGHVADAQYIFCSMATGKVDMGPGVEKSKTTKADLVASLKEAFGYCDKVYDGLTDASAGTMVKFIRGDAPKVTVLDFNTAHADEHYGNIVTYMRLKGLVPPSSEPAPATR
jgi:uncharacterized damage-inducible protein DinB